MSNLQRQLDTYIKDIRPRYEDMLGQAVEIPSISMDPRHAPAVGRMAELASQYLRAAGAIAAPALGIDPESALDQVAATRLSTVYLPGNKITMLPDAIINHFTLTENRLQPSLSLYLDVADDFTVISSESKIEKIKVTANLRHNSLEQHFNETSLNKGNFAHIFSKELSLLWKFA